MERTQFTVYESFYKAIARMRKKSDQADTFLAMARLALYGEEPDIDNLPDAVGSAMELIAPVIRAGSNKAANRKNKTEQNETNENKTEQNDNKKENKKEREYKRERKKENDSYLSKEKKRESPTAEEYGEVRRLLEGM